jgi:hypothetical protein
MERRLRVAPDLLSGRPLNGDKTDTISTDLADPDGGDGPGWAL